MFGVPTIRTDIKKRVMKSVGDINVFIIFNLRTMVMNLTPFNYLVLKNSAALDSLLKTSNSLDLKKR